MISKYKIALWYAFLWKKTAGKEEEEKKKA